MGFTAEAADAHERYAQTDTLHERAVETLGNEAPQAQAKQGTRYYRGGID